ncbi:hypothetical protein [Burkholderia sp. Bp8986]|uniref:hypothetical protein n=1 Tax=Burkholderia sp. Bp8986 TaxID=2184550 RepID=UPI000F5A9E57|nr:hypothetical protein [Burkholderia sp. Bp8986]RQS55667.1 hypothetical protein DID99_13460 [Burkholderia sp. Bp8986]
MKSALPAMIVAFTLSGAVWAQDSGLATDPPVLKVGDSWSYTRRDPIDKVKVSHFQLKVTSVSGETVMVTRTPDNSAPSDFQTDRSWSMPTEIDGQNARYRYLDFPLTPGKSWKATVGWSDGSGDPFKSELEFTVLGPERVTVPAGTFDTIKIAASGMWEKINARARGAIAETLWYAPQVKRFVRYDVLNNGYLNGPSFGYSLLLDQYQVQ